MLQLLLDLQVQPRILDQALANLRRRVAPGSVQLSDLTARERLLDDPFPEPFTRLAVDTRQRHQGFHRRLRGDLATPDPFLDRCRKILHQSQAPRNPGGAAVQTPGQLLLVPTGAARQLRQQPPLLERRIARAVVQAALQEQGFGFAQIPQRRLHRVLLQALECPKPFVAVDDHVLIRRL